MAEFRTYADPESVCYLCGQGGALVTTGLGSGGRDSIVGSCDRPGCRGKYLGLSGIVDRGAMTVEEAERDQADDEPVAPFTVAADADLIAGGMTIGGQEIMVWREGWRTRLVVGGVAVVLDDWTANHIGAALMTKRPTTVAEAIRVDL